MGGGRPCQIGLTLFVASYVKTQCLYQGRKGKVTLTLCYLINLQLYKHQILYGIRNTVQNLRKFIVSTKSFAWLPWQLINDIVIFPNNYQNIYENN